MSSTNHAIPTTSTSIFEVNLDNALNDYTKKTGVDLTKYDFAKQTEGYNSTDEVLWLLRGKMKQFKEYREGNRRLIRCIAPIVDVVHALSAGYLGEAFSAVSCHTNGPLQIVGLAFHSQHPFSPAEAIFVGVDVLVAVCSFSSSFNWTPIKYSVLGGSGC